MNATNATSTETACTWSTEKKEVKTIGIRPKYGGTRTKVPLYHPCPTKTIQEDISRDKGDRTKKEANKTTVVPGPKKPRKWIHLLRETPRVVKGKTEMEQETEQETEQERSKEKK